MRGRGPFATLRWDELIALHWRDVDLKRRTIHVGAAVTELKDGSRVAGLPKSDAGKRTVAIPEAVVPELRWHMKRSWRDTQEDWLDGSRTCLTTARGTSTSARKVRPTSCFPAESFDTRVGMRLAVLRRKRIAGRSVSLLDSSTGPV